MAIAPVVQLPGTLPAKPADLTDLAQLLEIQNRILLLTLTGSTTGPITRLLPELGCAALLNGYQLIFRNEQTHLVAWEAAIDWATPGAAIRFAIAPTDASRVVDVANAAGGGNATPRLWIPPAGAVFARDANNPPGVMIPVSPLTNSDRLRQRVCDPVDLVKDRFWGATAATR